MKGLGGLKRQLRDFVCSVDPMPPCLPIDPKSGMGQVRDTREPTDTSSK